MKDKLLHPNAPVWKCFCHGLPHCTQKGVHTKWHAAGPGFGLSNSQVWSYRNSTFQSIGPNSQDRWQTPKSNSLTKEAVRSHWSISVNRLMHLSSGKNSHQTFFVGIHSTPWKYEKRYCLRNKVTKLSWSDLDKAQNCLRNDAISFCLNWEKHEDRAPKLLRIGHIISYDSVLVGNQNKYWVRKMF